MILASYMELEYFDYQMYHRTKMGLSIWQEVESLAVLLETTTSEDFGF
jgi:hypothetical protein